METGKTKEGDIKQYLVVSYLNLRKTIGFLGFFLPIILVIGTILCGNNEIQRSISFYYHTNMRNVFVGILCVVGFFLFSYKGYSSFDNLLGNLGCLFALGVAFLPTDFNPDIKISLIGKLHLASSALFFAVLIYFSLFLFTKSDTQKENLPPPKKNRNRVFYICGFTMLGCILLIALYLIVFKKIWPGLQNIDPVFWLETFALWAFGISWLTKGQLILWDITHVYGNKQQNISLT